MNILDRRDRSGLLSNLCAAMLVVVLMNGLIAAVNPAEMSSARSLHFEPPGYVIGLVWIVLFAALGAARWIVLASPGGSPRTAGPVLYLLLFCLAYPVYTFGLRNQLPGLIGNIATVFFALFVALRIRRISRLAAGLVLLVAAWVTFASFLIVQQIRS